MPVQLQVSSTFEKAKVTLDQSKEPVESRHISRKEGVAWAGSYHWRTDFKKRRDDMQNWTEYLFRN